MGSPTLTMLVDRPELRVAAGDDIVAIAIDGLDPETDGDPATTIAEVIGKTAGQHPQAWILISLRNTRPPTPAGRLTYKSMMARHSDRLTSYVAIEMDGFLGAAVRAFVSTLTMFGIRKLRTRVYNGVTEAKAAFVQARMPTVAMREQLDRFFEREAPPGA